MNIAEIEAKAAELPARPVVYARDMYAAQGLSAADIRMILNALRPRADFYREVTGETGPQRYSVPVKDGDIEIGALHFNV